MRKLLTLMVVGLMGAPVVWGNGCPAVYGLCAVKDPKGRKSSTSNSSSDNFSHAFAVIMNQSRSMGMCTVTKDSWEKANNLCKGQPGKQTMQLLSFLKGVDSVNKFVITEGKYKRNVRFNSSIVNFHRGQTLKEEDYIDARTDLAQKTKEGK